MNEQVMIYEVKSGAHANAEKLFDLDKKYFYWNQKFFRSLDVGDFVFVVNKSAPFVLFTKLDKKDIPVTNSEYGATIYDMGENYHVSGEWDEFIRLSIIEEIVPPQDWPWKNLGSAESVYLCGPRVNPDYATNRLINIEQLRTLSESALFQQVLEQSEACFSTTGDLNPAIVEALASEKTRTRVREPEFLFQKAQEKLDQFERFDVKKDFILTTLADYEGSGSTFSTFLSSLEPGSQQHSLLLLIGQVVSYLDRHAANKNDYNEYPDKRTLAGSGVRQNAWVGQLLRYRANDNEISQLGGSVRNAISYIKDPGKELTMLSEAHREMVAKNLLKKPYVKADFVDEVCKYFEPYEVNPTNPQNLTRIISNVLYEYPEVKRLWFEGPEEGEKHRVKPDELAPISYDDPYRSILGAVKTKPFVLFAGLSGSGKSRLVRTLAFRTCSDASLRSDSRKPGNFEIIPVRPNWHDSSELIGYVSRINGVRYVSTAFLRFLIKAWKFRRVPFFLCLDEMNLAPVEQYFAEYLSIVETRVKDGESVRTDYLLSKDSFEDSSVYDALLSDLGVNDMGLFENGIALPPNLVVVGTVNMDETTHSFSRKVLDRAMTIEMNKVDLHEGLEEGKLDWDYPESFISPTAALGKYTEGLEVRNLFDEATDVLKYLVNINEYLDGSPFKIAYRVRDEFLIYCYYTSLFAGKPETWLDTALDEMTVMKILSRIEGDEAKTGKLLENLDPFLPESAPLSRSKVREMRKRLASGYTSFWA